MEGKNLRHIRSHFKGIPLYCAFAAPDSIDSFTYLVI